jgi:Bacterial toxin homologue of phage lysozyme, C-term
VLSTFPITGTYSGTYSATTEPQVAEVWPVTISVSISAATPPVSVYYGNSGYGSESAISGTVTITVTGSVPATGFNGWSGTYQFTESYGASESAGAFLGNTVQINITAYISAENPDDGDSNLEISGQFTNNSLVLSYYAINGGPYLYGVEDGVGVTLVGQPVSQPAPPPPPPPPPSPTPTPTPDYFSVSAGQVTFDAEGNNDPDSPYYSLQIQWAGGNSGVTIGRGFDEGSRTPKQATADLVGAGIPLTQAKEIAKGAGLRGVAAKDFVRKNLDDIGTITPQQQQQLFEETYPRYVAQAARFYNKSTIKNGRPLPGKVAWADLSQPIRDVLTDFVYQYGPNSKSRAPIRAMVAGMEDSIPDLIQYIQNTPSVKKYEPGRHRVQYLESFLVAV